MTPEEFDELLAAYANIQPDEDYGKQTFNDLVDWLKTKHHFALAQEDIDGMLYVYQFFEQYGPELTYWMSGGFGGGRGGGRNSPTYADLMVSTDEAGNLRSFLATEENYNFMKQLETPQLCEPGRQIRNSYHAPAAIRVPCFSRGTPTQQILRTQ